MYSANLVSDKYWHANAIRSPIDTLLSVWNYREKNVGTILLACGFMGVGGGCRLPELYRTNHRPGLKMKKSSADAGRWFAFERWRIAFAISHFCRSWNRTMRSPPCVNYSIPMNCRRLCSKYRWPDGFSNGNTQSVRLACTPTTNELVKIDSIASIMGNAPAFRTRRPKIAWSSLCCSCQMSSRTYGDRIHVARSCKRNRSVIHGRWQPAFKDSHVYAFIVGPLLKSGHVKSTVSLIPTISFSPSTQSSWFMWASICQTDFSMGLLAMSPFFWMSVWFRLEMPINFWVVLPDRGGLAYQFPIIIHGSSMHHIGYVLRRMFDEIGRIPWTDRLTRCRWWRWRIQAAQLNANRTAQIVRRIPRDGDALLNSEIANNSRAGQR